MSKIKIALIIGHNQRSKGAYSSALNLSEYDYFKNVCDYINQLDDSIDIYCREPARNYVEEMIQVVNELNKHNYDCIIELHFNSSSNLQSNGCECLVHKYSHKGKNIAEHLLNCINKEYGIKIRGNGLIEVENSSQRGAFGICKTKAPYILIEPFFGSNPQEAEKFINYRKFTRFLIRAIRS